MIQMDKPHCTEVLKSDLCI